MASCKVLQIVDNGKAGGKEKPLCPRSCEHPTPAEQEAGAPVCSFPWHCQHQLRPGSCHASHPALRWANHTAVVDCRGLSARHAGPPFQLSGCRQLSSLLQVPSLGSHPPSCRFRDLRDLSPRALVLSSDDWHGGDLSIPSALSLPFQSTASGRSFRSKSGRTLLYGASPSGAAAVLLTGGRRGPPPATQLGLLPCGAWN